LLLCVGPTGVYILKVIITFANKRHEKEAYLQTMQSNYNTTLIGRTRFYNGKLNIRPFVNVLHLFMSDLQNVEVSVKRILRESRCVS